MDRLIQEALTGSSSDEPEFPVIEHSCPESPEELLSEADLEIPLMRKVVPFEANRSEKRHKIQNEKPWHRTAAWLYSAGHSREEIATACGVDKNTVSLLVAQEFFRRSAAEFLEQHGTKESLQARVAQMAPAAFVVLTELLNSKSDQVKLRAADSILDRALGKAPQIIKRDADLGSGDLLEESRRLDREIAQSMEQMAAGGIIDVPSTKTA